MNNQILAPYSIQAHAFAIARTPFTHNFWVLTGPENRILDQLHGLAYDPVTQRTKAVGNSSCLLQVLHDPAITWSRQPGQAKAICHTGDQAMITLLWQAALHAIPAINDLKLRYPDWWQHFYKPNCNSVFNTLGQIMNVPSPPSLLPTWAPGIHLIISQKIIDQFRYQPT